MSFIHSAAGPSRLGLMSFTGKRTVVTTSIRFVSPSTFCFNQPKTTSPPQPIANRATRPIRAAAPVVAPKRVVKTYPARPQATPAPGPALTAKPQPVTRWLWHAQPDDPSRDYTEETRTIFARPTLLFQGNPRSLLVGWFFAGVVIGFIWFAPGFNQLVTASEFIKSRSANGGSVKEPLAADLETNITGYIFRAGFILTTLGIVTMANRKLWNCVTRITQVRRIPRDGVSPPIMKIRLETAFDQARIPFRPMYKDFDPKDTSVYTIGRKDDQVAMTAGGYRDYLINLSETKQYDGNDTPDTDIVISQSRLEEVFGKLEPESTPVVPKSSRRMTAWQRLAAWARDDAVSAAEQPKK